MSIYDRVIIHDIEDIYKDEFGFAVKHKINNTEMLAIVHNANVSQNGSLIDLSTISSDCVVIVKSKDYAEKMPSTGSIFMLDDEEFRVKACSRVGGYLIKITIERIED